MPSNMSRSPQGNTNSNSNRAKRTKISNACDACQKRKSRCELVTALGCHRCRVLSTECSLADSSVPDGIDRESEVGLEDLSHAETSAGPIARMETASLLNQIDLRTREIRDMLQYQMIHSLPRPAGLGSGHQNVRGNAVHGKSWHTPADATDLWRRLGGLGITFSVLTGGVQEHPIQDPVTLGLCNEDTLREAFVYFLEHSTLAPLDHLVTSLALDPFIRTAILLFYLRCNHRDQPHQSTILHFKLVRHIEAAVHRALEFLPTPATILALYIISSAPLDPQDEHLPRLPDAFGAAAIASRLAHIGGFDEAALRIRQLSVEQLDRPEWHDTLVQACLWYMVTQRSAWIDLLTGSNFSIRNLDNSVILDESLIYSLSTPLVPLLLHIKFESDLLKLVPPVSGALKTLHSAIMYDTSLSENVSQAFGEFQELSSTWRERVELSNLPTRTSLQLLSLQLELAMAYKLCHDAGSNLPSPLGFETRFPPYIAFGRKFWQAAVQVHRYILTNHIRLNTLPSIQINLAFLGYTVIQHSTRVHVASEHANNRTVLSDPIAEELAAFRQLLIDTVPNGEMFMQRVEGLEPPSGQWKSLNQDDLDEHGHGFGAAYATGSRNTGEGGEGGQGEYELGIGEFGIPTWMNEFFDFGSMMSNDPFWGHGSSSIGG